MTRKEKIQWLKSVQAGTVNLVEAGKQLAVANGHFTPLLGIDLENYQQGLFPVSDLIMVKGVPCKIATGSDHFYEEEYV